MCLLLLTLRLSKSLYNRPGQEEGNVPFVENAGFGKYSGDPNVIADTVSSWLTFPDKLEEMRKAAFKAARPSATLDIAHDLAEMAFAYKRQEAKPQEILA
jgi:1,2-diacylglycerol 3-beta-galactosyltransferase